MEEKGGPAGRAPTVVQRLGVSQHAPLLVAGVASGAVLLYDLRAPRSAAAQLRPHAQPLVRCALAHSNLHAVQQSQG